MGIQPFICKIHGKTTAYVYRVKTGVAKGWMRRTCRQCRALEVKRQWKKLKAEVIEAYGGKCYCCSETLIQFLSLDHSKGDGHKYRKLGLRGYKLYEWLKKHGFPKEGFRIACYNCNCARGQYGECPHT